MQTQPRTRKQENRQHDTHQPTARQLAAMYADARSKEDSQPAYHELANAIYAEAMHRRGKDAALFARIIRK